MKLLPDSIRTRTIVVLLLGLTVSHLGSTVIYSSDREQALASVSERSYADRVATIAKLINSLPETLRQPLAEVVSNSDLQVSSGLVAKVPAEHQEDARWSIVHDALYPYFGNMDDQHLHVIMAPPTHQAGCGWLAGLHLLHGYPCQSDLRISLLLPESMWVNFDVQIPGPVSLWSIKSILSTLIMVVATLVISIWATGWIIAPLGVFARAAERLGMDVNMTPLPEGGPQEVRAATQAFNQMQQRIRNFVEDRVRMLAAISHDLRTPITRLRLRTEQLPIEATQQRRMLGDLDEMEQMVSASLDFARDEALHEPSKAIDLAALLGSICDDSSDAGAGAQFEWDERLIYRGRPYALKRLFSNVIDNAVRYGQQARVTIGTSPDAIEVAIDDDGPGIPLDKLEAVFKPFYRLDPSRNKASGGIGLGLATARSIARSHGGEITLQNRPEGGLRVIVTLPFVASHASDLEE
jgi:signal transduction histidine kinase